MGMHVKALQRSLREKIRKGKIKTKHIMADLNKYWALKEIKEICAPISIYECVLHTAFYEKILGAYVQLIMGLGEEEMGTSGIPRRALVD